MCSSGSTRTRSFWVAVRWRVRAAPSVTISGLRTLPVRRPMRMAPMRGLAARRKTSVTYRCSSSSESPKRSPTFQRQTLCTAKVPSDCCFATVAGRASKSVVGGRSLLHGGNDHVGGGWVSWSVSSGTLVCVTSRLESASRIGPRWSGSGDDTLDIGVSLSGGIC